MSFVTKDFGFEVKSIKDDGSFVGYGSVFGEVDSYQEVVEKGAFLESLDEMKSKGRMMPILWQHDTTKPIGVYPSMKEDGKGLLLEGKLLVADVLQAKEAHALMKAGAVTGLSIGYRVRDHSYDEVSKVRALKKLDLKETSLVTFPANDSARVQAIKAMKAALNAGDLPTLAQFERFLSDSGFTRKMAAEIATGGLKSLLSVSDSGSKGEKSLVDVLSNFQLKF